MSLLGRERCNCILYTLQFRCFLRILGSVTVICILCCAHYMIFSITFCSYNPSISAVNVGLAVGLSVGLFFFLVFMGVPICVVLAICYVQRRRRPIFQTRVVAAQPGVSTVVAQQGTSFSSAQPAAYPVQAPYPVQPQQQYYPTQPPPAPYPVQPGPSGYPASKSDAPPSYDLATTFPLQVYITLCNHVCTTVEPPNNRQVGT